MNYDVTTPLRTSAPSRGPRPTAHSRGAGEAPGMDDGLIEGAPSPCGAAPHPTWATEHTRPGHLGGARHGVTARGLLPRNQSGVLSCGKTSVHLEPPRHKFSSPTCPLVSVAGLSIL